MDALLTCEERSLDFGVYSTVKRLCTEGPGAGYFVAKVRDKERRLRTLQQKGKRERNTEKNLMTSELVFTTSTMD